jgi:hypothetical protein
LHQRLCGCGRLEAFGDHLQAERLGQPDDRANDRQVTGVGTWAAHESVVDLEHVDR